MGKRLRSQRRGKGSIYRAPSHRYVAEVAYPSIKKAVGSVVRLVHDPGHTSPLAYVKFDSGHKAYLLAAEGMYEGQLVEIGAEVEIRPGNVVPLGNIPEGTNVYNIEINPGDGGKLVRAAGTSAVVVSHGEKTVVQLPSGALKYLPNRSRATVGIVSGSGRKDKPFAKAGKKYHAIRSKARLYPYTRGVAMNPVDHPHGGGSHQHVGKPSSVSQNAWPGRKVGRIPPKKRGKKKKR